MWTGRKLGLTKGVFCVGFLRDEAKKYNLEESQDRSFHNYVEYFFILFYGYMVFHCLDVLQMTQLVPY